MSKFHNLLVKEIRKETSSAVSVAFEIPENLRSAFKFIPGQYITIQKELEGKVLHRAYSICSSPNSNEFRVAIKEVENGTFSVYANKRLQVGDVLEVSAPEGRFILETKSSNKKNYLALVAGSGITPVFSMIKSVLETEKDSKFVLVYGNKTKEETIFKNEIEHLAKSFDDRFMAHYAYSQKKYDLAYSGRIGQEIAKDIIENKNKSLNFDEYFLCGPEEMIDLIKETLLNNDVDQDMVKFELFTSSSKKNEIDSDLSENSQITVILDEEETSYQMGQDELILNAALAQGIDAPYSCQGGICSSCLARVVEGKAVMEKNTILNAEEVVEGLILTCQAHPTTSVIKIDFDDV